jgi:hypothetical protein
MYLVAVGLAAEVRRFLKLEPDDDGGSVTTAQLDLWPQKLREAVAEIGQARVFVPSRAEFVMLTPMTISAAEAKEAGGYLVSKGNECIRRGTQLIALADRM